MNVIRYVITEVKKFVVTRFEDDGQGTADKRDLGEHSEHDNALTHAQGLCNAEMTRVGDAAEFHPPVSLVPEAPPEGVPLPDPAARIEELTAALAAANEKAEADAKEYLQSVSELQTKLDEALTDAAAQREAANANGAALEALRNGLELPAGPTAAPVPPVGAPVDAPAPAVETKTEAVEDAVADKPADDPEKTTPNGDAPETADAEKSAA